MMILAEKQEDLVVGGQAIDMMEHYESLLPNKLHMWQCSDRATHEDLEGSRNQREMSGVVEDQHIPVEPVTNSCAVGVADRRGFEADPRRADNEDSLVEGRGIRAAEDESDRPFDGGDLEGESADCGYLERKPLLLEKKDVP